MNNIRMKDFETIAKESEAQRKRFKAFMLWAQTYGYTDITMTSPVEMLGSEKIPDLERLFKLFLEQENYHEEIV